MSSPRQLLKAWFGFDHFRGLQESVIQRTIQGLHSLVIMPTGGGKSLCYQIPALHFASSLRQAERAPLTLVLSPLIALMKDQVDALNHRGISATFINSSLSKEHRDQRYQAIALGQHDLLYVTPERFRKPEFLDCLRMRQIVLLAVDEAHCISQWGHDFRPDYTRLGEIRKWLGNPPTLALTATATPQVQEDIVVQLGLQGIGNNEDECQLFHEGIDRPNLELNVEEVWGHDEKLQSILKSIEMWRSHSTHASLGSGIIYFTLIRTLEEFSQRLRKHGVAHGCYHGDLTRHQRREVQEQFMQNPSQIVLATNAFGMGIDKEDIRFVIHAELPGSLEAYYQEVGRAGRDGRPAECRLLYDSNDLNTQMEFIYWSNPDADFYIRVYHHLIHDQDSIRALGIEWLREKLCHRNRNDRRLETVLSMLFRYGVIENEHDLSNIHVSEPLPPWLADPTCRSAKLLADQKKLLALVEYAQQASQAKQFLNRYFGMPT